MAILAMWTNPSSMIQLMNLVAVSGFLIGPLIVKPFLSEEMIDEIANGTTFSTTETMQYLTSTASDNSSSFYDGGEPTSPPTTTSNDSNVIYVFVIVALCSFVVGVANFVIFLVEIGCNCRRKKSKTPSVWDDNISGQSTRRVLSSSALTSSVIAVTSSTAATTSPLTTVVDKIQLDLNKDNSCFDNAFSLSDHPLQSLSLNDDSSVVGTTIQTGNASTSKSDVIETADVTSLSKTTTTTRQTYFVRKIMILYFVLNVFYAGIEIGYAGLVMTFAVKYPAGARRTGRR